ncbi:hypothetical protein GGF46_000894 [Coemansia sp. RSA 552]|nr:hypothetical protein GGF46_000894 [Coemansia sp. RSA 552]
MKSGRHAPPVSQQAAATGQGAPRGGADPSGQGSGAQSQTSDENDLESVLDAWWDQVLCFFVEHRATAAFAAWLGVFLVDIVDIRLPAEWLVFTLFSFSVFVQAFGMSILLFTALTAAMTVLNVSVYYTLPFSATSLLSTVVVCMLLVRGVHGLDSKGWAVTMLMSLGRINTPWCKNLPDYLQAPVAAYCASFGLLWMLYHSLGRLEPLLDPLCLILGVIPPQRPQLRVSEIGETSVDVCWSPGPGNGPSTASAPADDSLVRVGGLFAVERRRLPEARVLRYEIEVNGRIVDRRPSTDSTARVRDLLPATTYQIRVWALSVSHGRVASKPGFVKTLAASGESAQSQQELDAMSARVEAMLREAEEAQRATEETDESTAALRVQSERECEALQKEIAELRLRRKGEDAAKAAQRDRVRELEAEKRRLDKEKAGLNDKIADAAARKQRALDRKRSQEEQAAECQRAAKSIWTRMSRERRDGEREKSELMATVSALMAEVDKAKQRLQGLSTEQSQAVEALRDKSKALSIQEKERADLAKQVKRVLQKRRQQQANRKEAAATTAKLQAEVDQLDPQLAGAIARRKSLETMLASSREQLLRLPRPFSAVAHPPAVYPASYGSSAAAGRVSILSADAASPTRHPLNSLPSRLQSTTPDEGTDAAASRHTRSASFVDALSDPYVPLGYMQSCSSASSGQHQADSVEAATFRRSTDLGDLLRPWDQSSPGLTTATSATASAGSAQLFQFDAGSAAPSVALADSVGSNGISTGFSRAPLWGSQAFAPLSLSTTTAEASALSILKDTDLAYPTPRRPSYNSTMPTGGAAAAFGGTGPLQPPPAAAHSAYGNVMHRFHHHNVLSRVLAGSFEGAESKSLGSRASRAHSRLGSVDLQGWADPSGPGAVSNDNDPFLLRSASPAEQPPVLFSGDVLGVHRPATPQRRPHVEPIGAPARRQQRSRKGASLGMLPTRSHDHLPLDGGENSSEGRRVQCTSGSQSCRASMEHSALDASEHLP